VIKFGLTARDHIPFWSNAKEIEEQWKVPAPAWTQLRPGAFMQVYLRETPSVIHEGASFFALADELNRSTSPT
jgi:hypothetical protein